ncbi:hypothetical protein PIB30_109211, partial [Stylosanthes scabra]|nr:hypothetical protein [Stylosanthes scabra]
ALIPDWMRAQPEVHTWRSAVPVVCFNFVHMHHIDRVIRQYGGEQPVPRLPVDVTRYMSSTGRGDDVWWPQGLSTWYEGWQRRRSPEVLVTVHGGGDPRGHQQYYEWFARVARRGRFLSRAADLADPRWTLGPAGIPVDAPAPRRRQPQPLPEPTNLRFHLWSEPIKSFHVVLILELRGCISGVYQ